MDGSNHGVLKSAGMVSRIKNREPRAIHGKSSGQIYDTPGDLVKWAFGPGSC
jgi:hypothetical protein